MVGSSRTRFIGRMVTAACAVALSACNLNFSHAEARAEWRKSYSLTPGGTLEIDNTNGVIEISPSSGTTVDVVAVRIAHGATDDAAKQALAHLTIKESASPDHVVLDSSEHSEGLFNIGASNEVQYHVKAPRGTNVKLTNTNGDITVADLGASFEAHTTNGDIHGNGLSGKATAETTNGEVALTIAQLADAGVTCETTNGGISVTIPKTAKARLDASVTNGDISVQGLDLATTENSRRRMDATIGGGGPTIHLSTTNGDVTVKGS